MIVIHTFEEAHRLYQQAKIPLRLLQDQAMVLANITPQPNRYIDEAYDITQSDIEWLLLQEDAVESYDGILGGFCHICEVEVDLKEILGIDMEFAKTNGNRWPNATEQVMSWDDCKYIKQQDGSAEWALFLLCWNDAGGPVFYVPKHLWAAARVPEHIAATNRAWQRE